MRITKSKKLWKKKVFVVWKDVMDVLSLGTMTQLEVAKKFNISLSTVHKIRKKMKSSGAYVTGTTTNKTWKVSFDKEDEEKSLPVVVSLSIQMPNVEGYTEIKIRAKDGLLVGTIIVEEDGIMYRRPNQKSGCNRKLGWATLDKLMQLGLS